MYHETTIIRGNKQISNFEYCPNADLDLYLRSHPRSRDGEDWLIIDDLTEEDVQTIKDLCRNQEEKELLEPLQPGDGIDIMLHSYLYVCRTE